MQNKQGSNSHPSSSTICRAAKVCESKRTTAESGSHATRLLQETSMPDENETIEGPKGHTVKFDTASQMARSDASIPGALSEAKEYQAVILLEPASSKTPSGTASASI